MVTLVGKVEERSCLAVALLLLFFTPLCEPAIVQHPSDINKLLEQVPTIKVNPSSIEAGVGQHFTINVTISNVNDLFGWEFKLGWNSSLLDATSVNEGPFLKTAGETFFTYKVENPEGYMIVDCTLLGNVAGASGNGTLAVITFYVGKPGSCPLDLYDTILVDSNEESIPHEAIDGSGTFTSYDPPSGGGYEIPKMI